MAVKTYMKQHFWTEVQIEEPFSIQPYVQVIICVGFCEEVVYTMLTLSGKPAWTE